MTPRSFVRARAAGGLPALVLLLLLAACDREPPTEVTLSAIELTIVSPAEGSTVTQGEFVTLTATATATDIGTLPDDSVRWSVDGTPLAPGPSHTIRPGPGEHTFEVEARYGAREAQRTLSITVAALPPGSVAWRSGFGTWEFAGLTAGADGTLYVQDSESELLALGPDGSLRWRATVDGHIGEHAPVIFGNGSAFLGTWERGVVAVTPDGAPGWMFPTQGLGTAPYDHVHGGAAVGADGTIYFGTEHQEGIVVALHPDGSERWVSGVRETDDADAWQFLAAPVLIGDSLLVIAGKDGDRAAGLDARTGEVLWRWVAPPGSRSQVAQYFPAVTPDGDAVIALTAQLIRFDQTGTVVWEATYPAGLDATGNAPAIAGDRIYVPTVGGAHVYGLDGTHITTFGSGGWAVDGAVTVGRGGVVYTLGSGALRSFTPDGTLRYEVPVPDETSSFYPPSGPILAADGTVYVASPVDGVIAVADTVGPSPDAAWPTSGGGFSRLGRRH